MKTDVDVVILGAGMAGLALSRALTGPGRNLSVTVLEPRTLRPDTRLWTFPAASGHALARFARHETRNVSLAGRDGRLQANAVWTVPAADVQGAALEALSASVGARIEAGVRIGAVSAAARGAVVDCSLGQIRARQVVDTRPGADHAVGAKAWTQIVLSARIEGADNPPRFEMGAPVAQAGGINLIQRHDLGGGVQLVEAVRYAPPGDDGAGLRAVLDGALAAPEGAAPRRTVLPLLPPPAQRAQSGAIIAAPARAGGLRFAVGMEALRLARWAQASAQSLDDGRLIAPPPDPGTAARAPALTLARRLREGAGPAAAWFTQMLTALEPDAAIAFLAGSGPAR
ncbi:MAG: hypothetical protein LAT81_07245 [Oceanicaulis sp.]|nr:hypothetical protein [Oceanicaulis sp.]